jgi:hypothetical protein
MEIPISAWHQVKWEMQEAAVEQARAEAIGAPLARTEGTHVLIDWI